MTIEFNIMLINFMSLMFLGFFFFFFLNFICDVLIKAQSKYFNVGNYKIGAIFFLSHEIKFAIEIIRVTNFLIIAVFGKVPDVNETQKVTRPTFSIFW